MITMKKILIPTDFSKGSESAIRYGCELAAKFNAEIHLLNVLPETVGGFEGYYAFSPEVIEDIRKEAHAKMNSISVPESHSGQKVIKVVVTGVPFLEIVRYAKNQQIDLIVMGTYGRGAISHILLGSVAERVVRKAPCPVLTVRNAEPGSTVHEDSAEVRSKDSVTV
ncbi:MAG: universal stress protein [Planctomycetaceae bacterium]